MPWAMVRDFGQHRLAGYRQGRPAGRFAVEQRQAQLGLEIVDAIGDDRSCPVKAAAGGGEAARLRDCQENAQLVEGRSSWLGHRIIYSAFSNNMINIIPVFFEAPQAIHPPSTRGAKDDRSDCNRPKAYPVGVEAGGFDVIGRRPARSGRTGASSSAVHVDDPPQPEAGRSVPRSAFRIGYNDRQIAALGLLSL